MRTGTITKNDKLPEKRANSSFHFHGGNHILIGGGGRSKEYNDIWNLSYNKDSYALNWQKVDPKGAISYTPRTGQASTIVGDRIFVFGGQNYHDQKQYNEAFFYDIKNNTWEALTKEGAPEGRNSGSAVYDEKNNRVIVYGGANLSGPLNDIYAYNLETSKWEKLETKGTLKPVGREMQGTVAYKGRLSFPEIQQEAPEKKEKTVDLNFISGIEAKKKGEDEKEEEETKVEEVSESTEVSVIGKGNEKDGMFLLIFGGRHGEDFSQEILCLDLETLEWKYLGNMPFTICAHSCELANEKVFVFAGTDGMQFLDNLYYYDLKSKCWFVYKRGKNEEIYPRIAASMSYNPEGKELLIFGGCSYEDELNETKILSVDNDSLKKNFQPLKL